MKYFNWFPIFCVCLLVHIEANDIPSVSPKEENISDTAKSALEELEKIISAVVNIALESINGAERAITELEGMVLELAKDEILQLGNEIFAKLDELKKEADILGVDIIDCIENREDDIKQLLVTFLNKTGDCAVQRVNQVFDSLSVVVLDIQNANDLLKELTQRLENCENEADVDACIAKVLEDITDAALEIPPKVMGDVNKSKKIIDELINYLFECYHDNYNNLEITALEIYKGIVECVQDKSSNPTIIAV